MNKKQEQEQDARAAWWAVMAAGLATFSVVTTEMLPVGLLTAIAQTLSVSTGAAGLMVSLPALVAAIFAPLLLWVAGALDRRRVLSALLVILVLANVLSACAPNFGLMLLSRVLVGLAMGGIWAIAGGLASRLVPAPAIGLATSIIFGGVAAASVLGVPLGVLIGDASDWRRAFGAMAVFSAGVLVFHWAVMPALPVAVSVHLRLFVAQLRQPPVQVGLGLSLLLVSSHFMGFTYVRPYLLEVSGFEVQAIGPLLLAYGAAGMVGNFVLGTLAARHTAAVLLLIASVLFLAPLLMFALGHHRVGAALALVVWGLAYGGVSVGLMAWMMRAAPQAIEAVSALYVSVFNLAIAAGAWWGGQVVDAIGLSANGLLASIVAATAVLVIWRARRLL